METRRRHIARGSSKTRIKGQKSEGSRRKSRYRWNILTPATQNFSGGNILTAATRSQPAALFHFGGRS